MATMCRNFLNNCQKRLIYQVVNRSTVCVKQFQYLSSTSNHNNITSHSWLSSPCIHHYTSSPVLLHSHSKYLYHQPVRYMTGGEKPKGFFKTFYDNIRQDLARNKEMKDSLDKFKEETSKLEQSDAIKKAREKFDSIEAETKKGGTILKQRLGEVKEKLSETFEEVGKTEFVKKSKGITGEIGQKAGKAAGKAAETITKQSETIGKSQAFRSISQTVKAAKTEFDEATLSRAKMYRPPEQLRKRSDKTGIEERVIQANTEATGLVDHKDNKYYQSWVNFKDNNKYINRMFDYKMKYDESDNRFIRITRTVTDRVGQVFAGMFSKTEMSEVVTEVCKIDPKFDIFKFVKLCEVDIIPNILEAIIRGDLDILKDWCYEAPYNTLAHPIEAARKLGYRFDSKVLDVDNVDVVAGKLMEQGPVFIISFESQQILTVKDSKGVVKEGDPDKILKVQYVWALCRDQEEFDPLSAWKLLDISASSSAIWI